MAGITKHVIAVAGVLSLAAAVLAAQDTPSDANLQTYVDGAFKVVLRCPAEWTPTPGYGFAPSLGPDPKHRHPAFGLSAAGWETSTAQQLCKADVEHVLRPFGTSPTIRPMKVQGQNACLIWPSSDQRRITGDDTAELIVKYPKPVEIDGIVCPGESRPCSYGFLTLNADKKYIMQLIRNLKFLAPDPQNAPFLMKIAFAGDESSSATVKAGLPVVLTVTIDNNSGQALRVPLSNPITDYQFSVLLLGPSSTVAVTGKYRELMQQKTVAAESVTLAPHSSYSTKLEISSLYQLHNPAIYIIQGTMRLPAELGVGLVNSNRLTLTVTANPEGDPRRH